MLSIYKANLLRLIKNPLFIGGLIIAFAATYMFTGVYVFPPLADDLPEYRMIFVSVAMILYFSFFSAIFINSEYSDGIIRNRIIAGYAQQDIYLSHVLTQYTALFIMHVVYIIAGILAGARITGNGAAAIATIFVAMIGYVTLMCTIGFRIKKVIWSVLAGMLTFNLCFNCILFGNALITFSEGTAHKFFSVAYFFNAMGQWFALGPFSSEENYVYNSPLLKLGISLALCVIFLALGHIGLKKRDLA